MINEYLVWSTLYLCMTTNEVWMKYVAGPFSLAVGKTATREKPLQIMYAGQNILSNVTSAIGSGHDL